MSTREMRSFSLGLRRFSTFVGHPSANLISMGSLATNILVSLARVMAGYSARGVDCHTPGRAHGILRISF